MSLVRLKDRPALTRTVTISVKPGVISEKKKVYVPEVKTLEYKPGEDAPSKEDVPFYHGYTQNRRVEATVYSSEAEYRSENYPSINEMLDMRRKYLKKRDKELKEQAKKEQKRKELEEEQRKLKEKLQKGKIDENESELKETIEDDDDPEDEEFKMMALIMKEKKLVNQRMSYLAHHPIPDKEIFKIAIKIKLFNGKMTESYTKVLPWMFCGNGDNASNSNFLMSLGITHILNVTKHVSTVTLYTYILCIVIYIDGLYQYKI
jgi:hypothetical protein